MPGQKLLKWTSIFLFVFSLIEVALGITQLFYDAAMLTANLSLVADIFVISSENASLTILDGVLGLAAGFVGLYMARDEATVITYYRLGILLFAFCAISTIFMLSQAPSFPWLRTLILIIFALCYIYGAWRFHTEAVNAA